MAGPLLKQVEDAVKRLQEESAALGGSPITDNSEHLSSFCMILERVFNQGTKARAVLSTDKRDSWSFFSQALEKSSLSQLIRKVQGNARNKTPVGRARSFVRVCLMAKSLGNVLQVWIG